MAKDLYFSLDLNLLRTFIVLIQEGNMRKASKRLFVSQPAISQSLQKLRHHFDDELFVKVRHGLEPTPFAEELANKITPYLDGLAVALNRSEHFSPADIDYKVKIAVAPIVLSCLSGSLFHQLKQSAPNCILELVGWNHNTLSDIAKGEVLFGVNYESELTQNLYSKKLIDLTGAVIVRDGHPINQVSVTAQDMAGYEIASLITPGWNDHQVLAAQLMSEQGIEAKIGFRTEFTMAAVDVISHTDMFIPHSNLFPIGKHPELRAMKAVYKGSEIQLPVMAFYHTKYRNNPLVNWLYKEVQRVLQQQLNNN
ncbi:LysR family transcriptional regulator [Vibrio sonorensis]|uniref:LysR family transcriptional regulator n=1 Tax=Vibrio sonorensis TaxID=1004316 RepID=UPI0008D9A145|nr:LysR family transcriptional regulator [Vibrio sonorensis]